MSTPRRRAASLLAATAVLLAGCSSAGPAKVPASKTPPSKAQLTAAYLVTVRPLYPNTNADTELVNSGKADCLAMVAGNSYETVLAGQTEMLGAHKARVIVAAAIRAFCPSYHPLRLP